MLSNQTNSKMLVVLQLSAWSSALTPAAVTTTMSCAFEKTFRTKSK
jgi:hypothetical protein